MPQNNLPGTARGARLCVSVADVLREDFDGVEAALTDNVESAAVLMTYRKDGTPVASSVSSHCRGPTLVDRATEIRIATSCSPPARRPDPIFWGRCRRVRRMTAHRRV
jgi:hypothetical protein